MPFRLLRPVEVVIPWDGTRLLSGKDHRLDLYPGLADWWRRAERIWMANRSSNGLTLIERLDYRRGLSQEFPAPEYRVVYTKSGMYLAAAIVSDRRVVIDHLLYWGTASSLAEARFLTAILNSTAITEAVRPLQARGEHNPRHFDKYVWRLPIPLFDDQDATHERLVELAEAAEEIVPPWTSIEGDASRLYGATCVRVSRSRQPASKSRRSLQHCSQATPPRPRHHGEPPSKW